ncbi:MAG: amidohydrolase family protein [Promethearchaeota archaeon]
MKFDINNPLNGLNTPNSRIWDAHTHIWKAGDYKNLEKWNKIYGIHKIIGIAQPEVRKNLEKTNQATNIVFAYYLPSNAFADINAQELLDSVDEAHSLEYKIVKMWFGPRFLDFSQSKKSFRIDHPEFEPVFSRIEEYGLALDIHIADPDKWYQTKYLDTKRYRTKDQAINEFISVLENHSSIRTIGVHFGCLPEHLEQLEKMFKLFPNYYIDTAATRWMIRELGKEPKKSRDFFTKYKERILFATDLSVGWQDRSDGYFAGRLWGQRLFWETNVRNVKLPFPDEDSPNDETYINGLNLPQDVLNHLYWKNAESFFG